MIYTLPGVISDLKELFMSKALVVWASRDGFGYNKKHHDIPQTLDCNKGTDLQSQHSDGIYQAPRMPTPQRMRSGCTTIRFPGDVSRGRLVCFERGRALSSSGSVSVTESQPESMEYRTWLNGSRKRRNGRHALPQSPTHYHAGSRAAVECHTNPNWREWLTESQKRTQWGKNNHSVGQRPEWYSKGTASAWQRWWDNGENI